jgi:hypothetical protein
VAWLANGQQPRGPVGQRLGRTVTWHTCGAVAWQSSSLAGQWDGRLAGLWGRGLATWWGGGLVDLQGGALVEWHPVRPVWQRSGRVVALLAGLQQPGGPAGVTQLFFQ